jgi:hypothetical protein
MPTATTRTPQTVTETTPTRTTRPRRVRGGRHDRAETALGGRGPRPDHVRVSVRVGQRPPRLPAGRHHRGLGAAVPVRGAVRLSMDYQVFLLSRVRHSATGDNAGSVSLRLRQRVHPAYIPQEAPGDPRPHPRIPATPRAEGPALAGNPRLSPCSPQAS